MIAAVTDYEWGRVSDEYGEETALSPPGLSVVCYAISMLEKRIEFKHIETSGWRNPSH